MQRLVLGLVAVVLFIFADHGPSYGQLVVVRPGYVRAPFVRVYTHPDGSSYVRAPFVGVYSPGQYSYGLYSPNALRRDQDNLADSDWNTLRRVVTQSARELDIDLGHFPTGDVWKSHFSIDTIPAMVATRAHAVPTIEEQADLAEIVQRFNNAVTRSELHAITSLGSFQVLHGALQEYVLPAGQRMKRQLAESTDVLHRALSQISTGAGWQEYLALPDDVRQYKDTKSDSFGNAGENGLSQLERSLERYDLVTQEEKYRMIASLPEFATTHKKLGEYVKYMSEFLPRDNTPAVVELPPPAADNP